MTKQWHQWDRRDRLLRAARKLFAGIVIASGRTAAQVNYVDRCTTEHLLRRTKSMVNRIDRELKP